MKSEARNPKSETISNVQNPNVQNRNANVSSVVVFNFADLNFIFVSSFGIRISSFGAVNRTACTTRDYSSYSVITSRCSIRKILSQQAIGVLAGPTFPT